MWSVHTAWPCYSLIFMQAPYTVISLFVLQQCSISTYLWKLLMEIADPFNLSVLAIVSSNRSMDMVTSESPFWERVHKIPCADKRVIINYTEYLCQHDSCLDDVKRSGESSCKTSSDCPTHGSLPWSHLPTLCYTPLQLRDKYTGLSSTEVQNLSTACTVADKMT